MWRSKNTSRQLMQITICLCNFEHLVCYKLWSNIIFLFVCLYRLACEKALRGALAAGQEKEGELATTSLEFEFRLQFPCGSQSTVLSDFRQLGRGGNECEGKQTLTRHKPIKGMTSLLMSSPPISISLRLFRCRYPNSRDVVARSPSFSRPATRAPRRAFSQAIARLTSRVITSSVKYSKVEID